MKKSLLLLLSFFIGGLAIAAEKPHAVIVVGTHHYSPQKTMPAFGLELERLGFQTSVINPDWDPEKDERGLPGLEALEEADVVLFYVRFLKLEKEQLGHITKYLKSGKPVVGFRTSTHAFRYPEGHDHQELNNGFGRDALGTPYLIHLAGKTQIQTLESAKQHPILTGVKTDQWESPGTLYLTKAQPGIEPLLVGTGNSKRTGKVTNMFGTHELQATMTDNVAWTWKNKWGGRVFTTSLGHAGDFNEPNSMRVMVNGVFWAAGQEVPSAETKVRVLDYASQPKKPKRKPTKVKKPSPAKPTSSLPEPQKRTKNVTLFYGNSFIERLQEDGTLEALLLVADAGKQRKYRSLAYTGDEVGFRIRPEKFGDHLDFITKELASDKVVMCFGMNEAFAGPAGLGQFQKDLEIYLELIKGRHPGAKLFLVSPTAIEASDAGDFPDPAIRNNQILEYCKIMQSEAGKQGVTYIDLFQPSQELFAQSEEPLTSNGLHLNTAGNRAIAPILAQALAPRSKLPKVSTNSPGFKSLRNLISRKAYEVATAYHPSNGIHYYGVRSRSYEYETEIPHHIKLANLLDEAIWKQAQNLSKANPFPKLPTAQASPPSRAPRRGLGKILSSKEDLELFTTAEGFAVNLFASSEDYPELINPLQIRFDAKGRLWVACFASYPVPVPGTLSNDTILIFEDTNGDGKADKRTVFADNLKLPDGFVLYKDGIIVSVAKKLVWLRDTDGDDVADVREELLRGADDTDTHHGGYLARSPQGHVIYCEGLFHRGQFETPHGPVRTKDAAALYLDPATRELSIERQTTHPNPWKISYNQWGESIQMFGGGQIIDCDFYNVWTPTGTSSSGGMGMPFRDDKGCTLAFVSSPHFPDEWQGGLVTGHLLGKNYVLYTPLELQGGTYMKGDQSKVLLSSTNKSFRPTDLEFGLDGALYVSDFYYPIIGHAQHSIRDPNRDYANGRIWRLSRKETPLAKPPVIEGAPLDLLFIYLTNPQVQVRELVRLELEKKPTEKVLAKAKSLTSHAKKNEEFGLELMWLFERARDFSETGLIRHLAKSKDVNVRRAAARSLRWWATALGGEARDMAKTLWDSEDDRTRIAILSVASHLQRTDPTWRDFIDNADVDSATPVGKVAKLAGMYKMPSLNREFPLLKVAPEANLAGWLQDASGSGGSLIVKSEKAQNLVLGFRGNAFINLDLNYIPLHRATGSQHTRNGQINITLEKGPNKITHFTNAGGKSRGGKASLYLANLVGARPTGLTFPKSDEEHLAWMKAYDDANAIVTEDKIRLKAVPAKMAFNATEIQVKAGHKYEFIFENPDHMLHNLVITQPGQAFKVGEMVDAMTAQPDAMAKHFVPDTDLILFSTPQIPYGGKFTKKFTTPEKPGRYPFLCTFPGHWRLMRGIMIVGKESPKPVYKPTPRKTSAKPSSPLPGKVLVSNEGVTIETAATPEGFQKIPLPKGMKTQVTANHSTKNQKLSILTDGQLTKDFGPIFGNGIRNGSYKMDLGSVEPIHNVKTWSYNMAGKRGNQRLQIFGSSANQDPGWDTTHFTPLGTIDTTSQTINHFTATSLTPTKSKTLGSYRWILWKVHPLNDSGENTAFQEFEVEVE